MSSPNYNAVASPTPPSKLALLGKRPTPRQKSAQSASASMAEIVVAPAESSGFRAPPAVSLGTLPLPEACARLPLPDGFTLSVLTGQGDDRQSLLEHWLRLSEEDRRMRFFSFAPDSLLTARAQSLNFQSLRALAIRDRFGRVVACGEWALDPETPLEAECAFSCDASERGQGLSKTLGLACFLDAAQFGVIDARIETLRDNGPARALARSLGARWVPDGPGFGVARARVSAQANPALRALAPTQEPQDAERRPKARAL